MRITTQSRTHASSGSSVSARMKGRRPSYRLATQVQPHMSLVPDLVPYLVLFNAPATGTATIRNAAPSKDEAGESSRRRGAPAGSASALLGD